MTEVSCKTNIKIGKPEESISHLSSETPDIISELLEFETMLSNLSTQFVELPADQIDRKIEEGLQLIAAVLKIDRCSVAQLNSQKTELKITHAYAAEGFNPILDVILNEQQPWYSEQLFQCKAIVISDISELPEEAANEKEHCRRQGIKSKALIPLVVGDSFLGVVGFAALKDHREWPEKLVQRLKMVGVVFANALMRKKSDIMIEELLKFETMLSNLSARFVELPANMIDQGIKEGIKLISDVLNIDRCAVAQMTDKKTELRTTHAFERAGIKPMPNLILNEQQPWLTRRLLNHETIVMPNIDDLPAEAVNEKEHCQYYGIQSMAVIPLIVGKSFLGFVSFAAMKPGRQWPEKLVQRLRTAGIVFANALIRKQSEEKLHEAFIEIKDLKDRFEAENTYLREEIKLQYTHEGFIGQCDSIKDVLNRSEQVASTDSTVLLLGETGTGKELLAQTVHSLSPRNGRSMITVNCAALPSSLVESELFGHERGAFTGAHSRRIGRFELADKSTLFLDEIGELSLEMQAKLLRVLQFNQFERLGGNETIQSDVRLIAATNRDLYHLVNSGEFRMDLFYRLNVFPIVIPPLRNRREDIPGLVWHFIHAFCEKMGKRIETVSSSNMQMLQSYYWPGNIRELKNIIERAMIISSNTMLQIELPDTPNTDRRSVQTFENLQREHIRDVLESVNWRVRGKNGAAGILNLKPTTLDAKMKKLGIKRPLKLR